MTKKNYNHEAIEEKWQKIWEEKQLFQVEIDTSKPKYYILDMFPYPSGSGLHVGHVTGYTATDTIARYKRQKGFNVLHPMGWDSFGLPAEQYAIRTGTHPASTTQNNINTYRRQLKKLGFSYDWNREITTSDPKYYKWTQWLFIQLYNKGLAYEAEVLVNFCPSLGTVLANEEVENGKAKEGGYPIERRPLRQWMLKITSYADRLLKDLELVDWPDHLKKLQINWIGRSEGAKIHFEETQTKQTITVFTTRPDTLFGVTYLVLSPEHPLVSLITTELYREQVQKYCKDIAGKSDLERTELNKEKTGVWTGAYARHPITDQNIPIWISDYVLMGYGTGAVMAVPAHDERDFAFAKIFHLPITAVITPNETDQDVQSGKLCWTEEGTYINSSSGSLNLHGLDLKAAKQAVIHWLENQGKGEKTVNYKLRDWLFSRQRYWGEPFPLLHFPDGTRRVLDLDELPLCPPELKDFKPASTGESPLSKVKEWVHITDSKTHQKAQRETNTMPQWAGSCWYYLRFCDPHNPDKPWSEEAEKYWMPVDLYVGGIEHAVLHLLYARFWHKVFYDCGLVSTLEPFQTLRNQGLVSARSYQLNQGGYVAPDDVSEENGSFFKLDTKEPLHSQIEKMSKSKLNGVTPDHIICEYGADSLRLYEMFMGPFDKEKLWNSDAVNGCYRFLNRFYDLVTSDKVCEEDTAEGLKLSHRLVYQVEKEIEAMQFNTAIAKMMEFINAFSPLASYPKQALKMAVQVLYPFAPHIAEELWEYLGETKSLTYQPFPIFDPNYLIEETVLYVVQINGKVRGKWSLPKEQTKEELLSFLQKQPQIIKYLHKPITKVVFVPNKLINLVCDV
ncbi:leucine--tRNA ligase [Candidatus Rhabdochlamydia sp. T3358]|uniref:leucine--tRNA ligase n=1 Tax=Candidatus Rhabdochlamydia sp. T3358 TaxID=2099795 RepID=UPI0010BBB596|nr:leucine--tRNA ligase [Candidatus Rhabdochlamydia sp. T3358]VHO02698.1 Leucine--tRNA ligase [Candidatus Rhabdochlamydia sp. T3358]